MPGASSEHTRQTQRVPAINEDGGHKAANLAVLQAIVENHREHKVSDEVTPMSQAAYRESRY
ncbi:MAG: hypothetical protein HY067_16655 [Betaproteobacteria bacterium]|nr:hypothetical protein [Betaproteobacteria bacterium]